MIRRVSGLGLALSLGLLGSSARAQEAPPLRVAVNCQSENTIQVCDYVTGYLGSTDGLLLVERSQADLMIQTNVTVRGIQEDLLLTVESLGEMEPAQYELRRTVEARQDAEEQQEDVADLTLEVLSPYLLQHWPGSLALSLEAPGIREDPAAPGSPWSYSIYMGSQSFLTSGYKDINLWGGMRLSSLHDDRSGYLSVNGSAGWLRQPPLVIEGNEISLDSESSSLNTEAGYAWDVSPAWSVGGWLGAGMEDPEQRFEKTGRAHLGIERNWFPSNDPRNNRFAIAYMVGVQADRYHQTNVYGEDSVVFPKQLLLASGSVRKGRMEYSFGVDLISELPNILTRYQASAWTFGSMYLGDHVDLNMWLDLTQQAIPGPEEIDQSDYEEITQASYAEPVQVNGYISIRVHWDRSNGAMYNRFYSAARQGPLENL